MGKMAILAPGPARDSARGLALVLALLLALILGLGGVGLAAPVDGRTARQALFALKGIDFAVVPQSWLSDADVANLKRLPEEMKKNGMALKYYGAIAAAPSRGGKGLYSSPTTLFAMDYHSVAAAGAAALAGCDARRARKGKPCVIVATVRPKGWQARPVQLNVDATRGFRKYRRGRGPKAFAISPATGQWAFAKGEAAPAGAIAKCNAGTGGVNDCEIVIAD